MKVENKRANESTDVGEGSFTGQFKRRDFRGFDLFKFKRILYNNVLVRGYNAPCQDLLERMLSFQEDEV